MSITPLQFEAVEKALQLVLNEHQPSPNSKCSEGTEPVRPEVRAALNQLFFEDAYEIDAEALAEELCDAIS